MNAWLKRHPLVALAALIVAAILTTYALIKRPDSNLIFWIWFFGYLDMAIILTYFIDYFLKSKRNHLARLICLTGLGFSLLLIFSFSSMELIPQYREFAKHAALIDKDTFAAQLVLEEHKKAVEEIKNRDLEEDSWFHNKFLLVGGLLAATLGYIKFGGSEESSPEKRLEELSQSQSTAAVLALACVVALGIDIHIRQSMSVVEQLGLWIRSYVEPLLHGGMLQPLQTMKDFRGWEEFLRTSGGDSTLGLKEAGTGFHSSDFTNLLDASHIHFVTALMYLLYILVFQAFAQQENKSKHSRRVENSIALSCFTIVHVAFVILAWFAHSAPEMFQFTVLPFVRTQGSGIMVPLYYLPPCIALVVLNWPYVRRYYRRTPTRLSSS